MHDAPKLVSLHTQALEGRDALAYLKALNAALGAARPNAGFFDRRRLQATLDTLRQGLELGMYPELLVDSRSGLPNLASITRARADHEVAESSLDQLRSEAELRRRAQESEVFSQLLARRQYFEGIAKLSPASADEHKVQVRKHDVASGTASFRLETSKLESTGHFLRVVIELTQVSSAWTRRVLDFAPGGESAKASEDFRTMIYRWSSVDAETLFVHLHEIEGVSVERVERGIIGPWNFRLGAHGPTSTAAEARIHAPLQLPGDLLTDAFADWTKQRPAGAEGLSGLLSLQWDTAALDVGDEKSNDPLHALMRDRVQEGERARYDELRKRFGFRVYKDRKFAISRSHAPALREWCKLMGTRNAIYEF